MSEEEYKKPKPKRFKKFEKLAAWEQQDLAELLAADKPVFEYIIHGRGIDRIFEDGDPDNLFLIAKEGYYSNELAKHEDPHVRSGVALSKNCLEELVNDENSRVREYVALRSFGKEELLAKLVNDELWPVREAVAKQGYGFDILVHDWDPDVRLAVFKYHNPEDGLKESHFGVDVLINDEDEYIRQCARDYLEGAYGGDIEKWKRDNPDKLGNPGDDIPGAACARVPNKPSPNPSLSGAAEPLVSDDLSEESQSLSQSQNKPRQMSR